MKGVSPLVAAVLLIAITMSIAGVLAFWASQFVNKSLPPVNETTIQCRFANFVVYGCTYDSNTSILVLTLNNIQSLELRNLTTYLSFSNGTLSSGINLNESISPAEFKSYILHGIPSDFSKIIISSQVCTDLSKESTCSRS